jgi:hypothetical protein
MGATPWQSACFINRGAKSSQNSRGPPRPRPRVPTVLDRNQAYTDFRHWLIAQGETIYQAALPDPETLVDVIADREHRPRFIRGQQFGQVAERAYEISTDQAMSLREPCYAQLTGTNWTDEDLPQQYPQLWAAFG